MRSALFLTLSLSCASVCWAQSPTPAEAPVEPKKPTASTGAVEKRTERIHLEDAGSRIDELRVGGETKTITVQPKGRMPVYEVEPTSGERSWKILGF